MASANRIRERYLHQLGLQRGGIEGAPTTLQTQQQQHVVVISGLPSLPEDRATTTTDHNGQQHLLESHDFSIVSRLTHHTHENASTNGDDEEEEEHSWVGNSGRSNSRALKTMSMLSDTHHSSKTTTSLFRPSISPNRLTSMALPCPAALKNVPLPPTKPTPSPTAALSSSLPFTLSQWRNSSLSKSASVLLDSAEYDSICSVGTCTTAESSIMLSKDWGAHPHHVPLPPNPNSSKAHHHTSSSAAASISSSTQGESISPVSSYTPGVHFQQQRNATPPAIGSSSFCSSQGQQFLLGHYSRVGGGGCAATSSLAHALNRFNIDSDCEASLASNSLVEDHTAMMDDNEDDTASRSSISSYISAGTSVGGGSGSIKSQHSSSQHHHLKKSKVVSRKVHHHQPTARHHASGIDRATAHERILKVRSDHSMKMRANLAQSHRNNLGNLSLIMAQGSSNSSCNSLGGSVNVDHTLSLPLEHHVHSSSSSSSRIRPDHPHSSSSVLDRDDKVCFDLGRTPTASNCCSDLHKLQQLGLVIDECGCGSSSTIESSLLPMGVHISQDRSRYPYDKDVRSGGPPLHHQQSGLPTTWRGATRPLQVHPELVSCTPNYPPYGADRSINHDSTSTSSRPITTELVKSSNDDTAYDVGGTSSLRHTNHSMEDVMEVAVTLSKLGGGGVVKHGSIPRFR